MEFGSDELYLILEYPVLNTMYAGPSDRAV